MSQLHKITSFLAVVTLLLSGSVHSAEELSKYDALFDRVDRLVEQGKTEKDWLYQACLYEAGEAGLTASGFENCLGRLVSRFERMSTFKSNIAMTVCAPQATIGQGITSDQCLANNLRNADFRPEEYLNHNEHDCNGHKNGIDLIAEAQKNLTVMTAIGCEPGEVPCVDDRVRLDTNGRHAKYRAVGGVSCQDNYTGKWQEGSLSLVTTDRINSSGVNQTPAIVAAHVFKDSRGGLNTTCNAYFNGPKGNFVPVKIVSRNIINGDFENSDPNDRDNDWGIIALEDTTGINLRRFIEPFELTAYNGDNLERDLELGKQISAAGYGAHNRQLEIDENCRAAKGRPGLVFSNPKLINHSCDTNGGSSGQGIFLGNRLIAIHSGSAEGVSHFSDWDFQRNANRGIFITQEMVEAAENLVLNP